MGSVLKYEDEGNYTALKQLDKNKDLPLEVRNFISKRLPNAKKESFAKFDKSAQNISTVKDMEDMLHNAKLTGDTNRINIATAGFTAIGNTFREGITTFNKNDIQSIVAMADRLNWDESETRQFIDRLSDVRFAHGADLFERNLGKGYL